MLITNSVCMKNNKSYSYFQCISFEKLFAKICPFPLPFKMCYRKATHQDHTFYFWGTKLFISNIHNLSFLFFNLSYSRFIILNSYKTKLWFVFSTVCMYSLDFCSCFITSFLIVDWLWSFFSIFLRWQHKSPHSILLFLP